jgi:hypothetical protein
MRAALARTMLALAALCMGSRYRDWGLAMQAELEEAIEAGTPLRFAFGCLVASWSRMPMHEEGRFSLTAYALALGLIVPVAAFQIGSTVSDFPGFMGLGGFAAPGSVESYLLASTYQVIPLLAALSLLLGAAQLRMAWVLLNRDWARVERAGAFTLAAAMTIIILLGLLDFHLAQALRQGAILLIELAALAVLVRWQTALPQPAWADEATG